jgi:transposase-like protein
VRARRVRTICSQDCRARGVKSSSLPSGGEEAGTPRKGQGGARVSAPAHRESLEDGGGGVHPRNPDDPEPQAAPAAREELEETTSISESVETGIGRARTSLRPSSSSGSEDSSGHMYALAVQPPSGALKPSSIHPPSASSRLTPVEARNGRATRRAEESTKASATVYCRERREITYLTSACSFFCRHLPRHRAGSDRPPRLVANTQRSRDDKAQVHGRADTVRNTRLSTMRVSR